ncbi:MAG: TonB-dependent receptor [Aromatoleum sp.]|nr:TonB-dependent receptor [Aromatoleum sp.]
MKFQRKKLAGALAYALGVGGALVVVGTPVQAADIKVDVTGSNIRRVEGEGALPVQVITRDDIEKSGAQTAMELIDRLSATQSLGNFNNTLGEGTTLAGFNGASLRGLGTQRTLVLLNGRRVAPYALSNTSSPSAAGVDINAIPLSAIERIEVLKDGASAVYGADAVGGVINFILRKDYQGSEASFTYLDSEHGGGGTRRMNGTVGFGDLATNKFNAFLTVDYVNQLSLRASDRYVSHTAYLPQFGVDRTSGNSLPSNISQSANDFGPGGGTAFKGTHNPGNPACLPPFSFPTVPSPLQCRFDYASVIDTIPPSEQTNVLGKVTWQITPNHQAFFEASYFHGDFTQRISPTPVSSSFTINPVLLFPSSPFYPAAYVTSLGGAANQPIRLGWRALEFGPRTDELKSDTWRAVAGLQGVIGGWDYQAAVRYTQNKQIDAYTDGYLSEARLLPVLASGIINPFGFNTPAAIAAGNTAKIFGDASSNKAKDYGLDAKISNEIYQMPAGPLALAAGIEARHEYLSLTNADFLSSGDIVGGAGAIPSLTSSNRNVWAVFGELSIPIVKTLEGNVQVRFDHYSDFGSTTNPKFAMRWQPTSNLLVRGSYGKGFRAPALADISQPNFRTNTNNSFSDPIRCPVTASGNDCDLQFNSQRGGNPSLKPERSDQYNAGVVWDVTSQLSVGADFFNVKINDVITILAADTIFANFAAYAPNFVVRNPPDLSFPNLPGEIAFVKEPTFNLGKQEVTGVDVDFKYRMPTAWGKFTAGLNGTYLIHYKQSDPITGDMVEFIGTAGAPQGAITRWKHYASVDWEYGPWAATVSQTFQNGYAEVVGTGPRRVSAYEIYDLQARYNGIKNVKLTAGIRNIFDRAPPQSAGVGTFQEGYDASYGDPRGRMFFGTLNIAFK